MKRREFLASIVAAPAIPYVPAMAEVVRVEAIAPLEIDCHWYGYDGWIKEDWSRNNIKWMADILGGANP